MGIAPLEFEWDGECMKPLRPKLADREYIVGEKYRLAIFEERSAASHNAYFAELNSVWENLPDEMVERWPTVEHLRKYALIKTDFCDERSIVCQTKAEAERIATFAKSVMPYAVVTLKDRVVTVYEAKSQSYRAMGREEFQRSKTAVLDYASSLIGTTRKQLEQNAGASA